MASLDRSSVVKRRQARVALICTRRAEKFCILTEIRLYTFKQYIFKVEVYQMRAPVTFGSSCL